MARVVVVGAGVVGLTTSVELVEAGHQVTVRTAELPASTTSAAAAAVWGPWQVAPVNRVLPWARHTLEVLRELARTTGTGVRLVTGRELARAEHEAPAWASFLDDRAVCAAEELLAGYSHGVRFTVPLVDMPVHLSWLADRFSSAGGMFEIARVSSLADLLGEVDVVVCCAGVGARQLAGDESVFPVRGQHLVVTNPGLDDVVEVDSADSTELTAIYPHEGHVVLSGTAEPNEWDRAPDLAAAERIFQRCLELEPKLAGTTWLEHRVGLRPTRPTIRLEAEPRPDGLIVHNYGHGGAGVSLAWGCADEVRELCTGSGRRPIS